MTSRGSDVDRLSLVRNFWNETPCDGQATYAQRAAFRYRKEPWLPEVLQRIAATQRDVLEIGCGQGTDGVTLCQLLAPGSRYTGVDMSEASLASARRAAAEVQSRLTVAPTFALGNAERLDIADGSVACVLSVGALHHSDDTERAIGEVHRVLAPDGRALVMLYRTWSPKLLAAHTLRGLQHGIDTVLRTDRVFYQVARAVGAGERFGTAIYECFGVPILRSYTRPGIRRLFRRFSSVRMTAHGVGLPPATLFAPLERLESNPVGYLWLADARK